MASTFLKRHTISLPPAPRAELGTSCGTRLLGEASIMWTTCAFRSPASQNEFVVPVRSPDDFGSCTLVDDGKRLEELRSSGSSQERMFARKRLPLAIAAKLSVSTSRIVSAETARRDVADDLPLVSVLLIGQGQALALPTKPGDIRVHIIDLGEDVAARAFATPCHRVFHLTDVESMTYSLYLPRALTKDRLVCITATMDLITANLTVTGFKTVTCVDKIVLPFYGLLSLSNVAHGTSGLPAAQATSCRPAAQCTSGSNTRFFPSGFRDVLAALLGGPQWDSAASWKLREMNSSNVLDVHSVYPLQGRHEGRHEGHRERQVYGNDEDHEKDLVEKDPIPKTRYELPPIPVVPAHAKRKRTISSEKGTSGPGPRRTPTATNETTNKVTNKIYDTNKNYDNTKRIFSEIEIAKDDDPDATETEDENEKSPEKQKTATTNNAEKKRKGSGKDGDQKPRKSTKTTEAKKNKKIYISSFLSDKFDFAKAVAEYNRPRELAAGLRLMLNWFDDDLRSSAAAAAANCQTTTKKKNNKAAARKDDTKLVNAIKDNWLKIAADKDKVNPETDVMNPTFLMSMLLQAFIGEYGEDDTITATDSNKRAYDDVPYILIRNSASVNGAKPKIALTEYLLCVQPAGSDSGAHYAYQSQWTGVSVLGDKLDKSVNWHMKLSMDGAKRDRLIGNLFKQLLSLAEWTRSAVDSCLDSCNPYTLASCTTSTSFKAVEKATVKFFTDAVQAAYQVDGIYDDDAK